MSRVQEYQKLYRSNPNTVLWMRGPKSKLAVYPFYALFAITCVASPLYLITKAVRKNLQ